MSARQGGPTREPLRFRGTPGSLSAAARQLETAPRRFPVRLEIGGAQAWESGETVLARASRIEGDMVLRMALPRRTPPGTYQGTVELDGEVQPVVIEVEPEIELQVVPDQLTLRGHPGEHVAAELTIANAGNVPVEIRNAYAFGIFASGGLERALYHAYVDERPGNERRIDYLADRLAEEHGGVVRTAVEEGAGEIEPGETREVRLTFNFPTDLRPGRTYSGTVALYDLRYYVRLIVSEKAAATARKAK